MAFLRLVNRSHLKCTSNLFTRNYFQASLTPSFNHAAKKTEICSSDTPNLDICRNPTSVFDNARFFASSVLARMKEAVETDGPRLNEHITAPFVRLVTEEGHSIVSRKEALMRAKQLEIDLVEVQRDADPPVCKIMDYKFEKYKRAIEEKERAKAKRAEATLRPGVKEVKFTSKTELKDLKFKADQATKMMERGYRVKCVAVPDKKNDLEPEKLEEKLVELLSHFTPLIGDSVVENGPLVEKKQAFVVVRHAQFGHSKKGGSKKLKDINIKTQAQRPPSPKKDSANDDRPEAEKSEATWSTSDSGADFDQIFDPEADSGLPKLDISSGGGQRKPGFNANHGQPVGDYNRYAKREPANQFTAAPVGRDGNRFDPRFQNQQPLQPRFSSQDQQPSQAQFPNQNQQPSQARFPNQNQQPSQHRFPNQAPNQQPSVPRTPRGPASGYGIFSDPRTNRNSG